MCSRRRCCCAFAEVSARTARKWAARFRAEGEAGLFDPCSAPARVHNRTCEERIEAIAALRRLRMTGEQIARCLGMPDQTVSGILTRIGMGRLGRLGQEQPVRFERSRPGELVHVDVKKLGKIARPGHAVLGGQRARAQAGYHRKANEQGWEFVHVAIDDATRLAYVEVLDDERATTAIAFFKRALRFFARYGIKVERVISDNGSCYRSKLHAICCRTLGIRHLRTRPYRPRTNGKAERFIQTLLNEWAYARIYGSSQERTSQLDPWLQRYNYQRPHGSLSHQPPAARINNLLGNYT